MTDFDLLWSKLPSPDIELNQARIDEFLNFTKMPKKWFKNKCCLDMGCGSGRYTWVMQQLGGIVTSYDESPEAIKKTKLINPNAEVRSFDQLRMFDEPFDDQDEIHIFDFILSWGVLHHTPTPEKNFYKLVNMLDDGGLIHIMVYHIDGQQQYIPHRIAAKSMNDDQKIRYCKELSRKMGGTVHGWLDAILPTYNFGYTEKEVVKWFLAAGLSDIKIITNHNINIQGWKK